jgi:hypothetical protein
VACHTALHVRNARPRTHRVPTATKVACSTVVVTPGAEPMLLPVTELRTKAQHRSCTGKEGRTEATHAHCDINAPRIHTERQNFMHEREHLQSEQARGDGGLARGQKPTLAGAMCGEPTTGANSRMQLGLAAANTRDQPGQQETHWEVWTSEPCRAWRGGVEGGGGWGRLRRGKSRAWGKHQGTKRDTQPPTDPSAACCHPLPAWPPIPRCRHQRTT